MRKISTIVCMMALLLSVSGGLVSGGKDVAVLNSNGVVANTSLPLELNTTGIYVKIGDTKKGAKSSA